MYLNSGRRCARGGRCGWFLSFKIGLLPVPHHAAPRARGDDDRLGASVGLPEGRRRGGVVCCQGEQRQAPGHHQH